MPLRGLRLSNSKRLFNIGLLHKSLFQIIELSHYHIELAYYRNHIITLV
jgi:hypothetical protein